MTIHRARSRSRCKSSAGETGTALIWITHDLSVVAGLADHIAVMAMRARSSNKGRANEVLGPPAASVHRGPHWLVPRAM